MVPLDQLIEAIEEEDTKALKEALDAGGDPRGADEDGWPLLVLATAEGDPDIVGLLLDAGADPDACNPQGESALMVAADSGYIAAAEKGHTEIAARLLDAGAPIDEPGPDGWTALLTATYYGHLETVNLLLNRGADLHKITGLDHATALMYAADRGFHPIAKALLDAGAKVDAVNKEGWSPLMEAAKEKDLEMVGLLLEHGADKTLTNSDGQTAYDLAGPSRQVQHSTPTDPQHLDPNEIKKALARSKPSS